MIQPPTPPTGTVSFLFTDIEGSTRLWQSHRAEMGSALARHDDILRSAIESHNGHVFSTAGDSFAAAFARAQDAVDAAIDAQAALGGADWGPAVVTARMGIHTGEAEEREGDYFGPAVNMAARLMTAAHGGQILLSSTTTPIVEDTLGEEVEITALGEHRLKDITQPQRIHQVHTQSMTDEFPPLRTQTVTRTNLPTDLTRFIGREESVGEVVQLLAKTRLLTLTGPGGVGKTRMALQAARASSDEFDDGVWLVELASIRESGLISKQIAAAIGIQEQADRPVSVTLLESLADSAALIVLDNCEQVIEGVAEVVGDILRSCPRIRILATSRERLGIDGELAWTVSPMPPPHPSDPMDPEQLIGNEAIQLLVERATLADRFFSLNPDNAEACAEICRRLEGVPLAIELAAARMAALSPRQVADRLDDRLALLTSASRSSDPRQRTLRGAIAWSYELLTPDEQKLLRRLSVFRGGFILSAVEAMWSVDAGVPILDTLGQLIDKSLVSLNARRTETRYGMLESIRQYAADALQAAGETDAAELDHRRWFTTWAATQGKLISTPDQLEALAALESDHDNLRALLERSIAAGDFESATLVAADISYFWWLHSHFGESAAWFDRLLEQDVEVDPAVRAKLLVGAGEVSMSLSRHDEAEARLSEALSLARETESLRLEAWALAYMMTNEIWRMNLDAARSLAEDSLEAFANAGDMLGTGYVMFLQGGVEYATLYAAGETDPRIAGEFINRFEPIVNVAQQFGERNLIGHVFDMLGPIELEAGHIHDAASHLGATIDAFDVLGNQICLAHGLDHTALFAARTEDPSTAATLLGATTALRHSLGVSARLAEQISFDEARSLSEDALSKEEFGAAWGLGAQMTRKQAVAFAKQALDAKTAETTDHLTPTT